MYMLVFEIVIFYCKLLNDGMSNILYTILYQSNHFIIYNNVTYIKSIKKIRKKTPTYFVDFSVPSTYEIII